MYRKPIRHLNSEKIIHHTYQMKQGRAYRVAIRNLHYSIPIDDTKDELQKKGHAVRNILNIRHRVNKYPLSMFYVDLEPRENKVIYILQYLNNTKINVEPPYIKIPSPNVQDVSSMVIQKHTARGPTNVWNSEETIWHPNAKNLKKHPPNAPYTQVNIQPTTRAVQSTGNCKMRKTTWQTENNKSQIDKPSHKITQTIQILSTRYELVPHIHR